MKKGWSQKTNRLLRKCPNCGRMFTCSGACPSPERKRNETSCYCPECLKRHLPEDYTTRTTLWHCEWRYLE